MHGNTAEKNGPGGRIKVLQVIRPGIGGAARHVELLLRHLDRSRFEVTVATSGPEGSPFAAKLRGLGARVAAVSLKRPLAPFSDLRAFLALLALMRRERFQVVHCHAAKAGFLGRIAARLSGVPRVVYTPHGYYFNYEEGWLPRGVHVLAERALARFCSAVVCTGPAERSQAMELRLAPPARLVLIPNAVDLAELGAAAPPNGGDGGPPEPGLTIGMVGRLSPPKDPLTFLRAAVRIHEKVPSTRFALVGEGELRPGCVRFVEEHAAGGYIRVLGHREDAAGLIARFDICVLSSRWEGMPYALLEGMALGKPVVTSRVPGCADVVVEGETGLLFPAGDAEGLAEALLRLIADPGLRADLGTAGRRRAVESHSMERWIRSIEGLYAAAG